MCGWGEVSTHDFSEVSEQEIGFDPDNQILESLGPRGTTLKIAAKNSRSASRQNRLAILTRSQVREIAPKEIRAEIDTFTAHSTDGR